MDEITENYYYFLTKNNMIQSDFVDKRITEVELQDFLDYGINIPQEFSTNDKQTFLICSKTDNIKIKILPLDQLLFNSKQINISHIDDIHKVVINGHISANSSILYIINNRENWYTFKLQHWQKLNLGGTFSPSEIIFSSGMTADEISNISLQEWKEIFPDEKKFISIMALLITIDFDDSPIISNIDIIYDSSTKRKVAIQSNLYSVENTYTSYKLIWKTSERRKMEIIYTNDNKLI